MVQRKIAKTLFCGMFVALLAGSLAPVAFANVGEGPALTVIVPFPPDDLALSLRFADGSVFSALPLQKESRVWEACYRFFWAGLDPMERPPLEGTALVVRSGEKSFELPLPDAVFDDYNSLLTLSIADESVVIGKSTARSVFLVAMRVGLTLLIEGAVLYAFGYRSKFSWGVFAVTNLLTQTALNALLSGPFANSYWTMGFITMELFIFIAETAVFGLLLTEHSRGRGAACALTANLSSLILGGMMLSYLPV